ncbi:MAG: DMT family transporter [Acidimicrobiia bacterium]|nr:DMT family transporter [Acidimicrobiia bacterium]
MADRRRVLETSDGTHPHFGPVEWGLLAVTSITWGSSYLWIALGLESFAPGLIAWLRLALGAGALALITREHVAIDRRDWGVISLIAVVGNAGPALAFAVAEQTLESSVVGMLTAAVPLATLAVAILLGNRSLRPIHAVGMFLGLIGVVILSVDNVIGAKTGVSGIVYTLLAVFGYALTANVIGPVVERYGAIAVILRAQLIAVLLMTPSGWLALSDSTFSWRSFVAVAILGVLGTGMARSVQAALVARAGAPRASVVGYLVPVVAAILGVAFLSETMSAAELGGLAIITVGAFLGTRKVRPANP